MYGFKSRAGYDGVLTVPIHNVYKAGMAPQYLEEKLTL